MNEYRGKPSHEPKIGPIIHNILETVQDETWCKLLLFIN